MSQNIGGVSHFIADMGVVIKDGIARHGLDNFAQGDVLITNHQAVAGQHLNNIVIYTPFFLDGVLTAFPAVRAHWVDVGGLSTGFGALGSTDPWSEGLQLNQLKIYEAGQAGQQAVAGDRRTTSASRRPRWAICAPQIAACRLAERRLEELYKRYGAETIAAAMEIIYSETERKCRAVVETIPDGVYEADNYVDAPGAKEPLVHIHVKVTVSGSDMEIDFTGTQPQTAGNNNSRTLAAAYIAYKGLTTPLEPANEGSFRALKAIVPEGCIMMAKYPAAMADWASPIPGSVDAVFKALAPAIPDRIPAGHFGYMMIGRSFTGYDPRRGKSFVLQTIDGGGWGGRPTQDGPSGSVTVCQGDVRNAPIESIEQKCPVIVEARELLPDTGRSRQISRRARAAAAGEGARRRPLGPAAASPQHLSAVGPVGRQARPRRHQLGQDAGRQGMAADRDLPAAGDQADRHPRRDHGRRRLGRSARSRARAGAHRCPQPLRQQAGRA